MMAWQLYDFDANWKDFYTTWQSEEVQDELRFQMNSWIEYWCEYAPQDVPIENLPHWVEDPPPNWEKGSPLWDWSADDEIWMARRLQATGAHKYYSRTMKAIGLPAMKEHAFLDRAPWMPAWDYLREHMAPQPGTLESLIMYDTQKHPHASRDSMLMPLSVVASKLFPSARIVWGQKNGTKHSYVLLPDHYIVFDLIDHYEVTRCSIPVDYSLGFEEQDDIFPHDAA